MTDPENKPVGCDQHQVSMHRIRWFIDGLFTREIDQAHKEGDHEHISFVQRAQRDLRNFLTALIPQVITLQLVFIADEHWLLVPPHIVRMVGLDPEKSFSRYSRYSTEHHLLALDAESDITTFKDAAERYGYRHEDLPDHPEDEGIHSYLNISTDEKPAPEFQNIMQWPVIDVVPVVATR